ncbi:GNAT family N-acetyltransferase [Thalassoroseus pseudoceratinae]|uniref:GNAT family N-acetyltransferase n=1 Tax=Thalassoroseus pseudoceratinae TaxID=2713176 RepID=UPI00142316C7|nr:GNAT family N-acetyltransferase [Thalassoroseus pseudoceratinae]
MSYTIRPGAAEDFSTIADFNIRMALETEDHQLKRELVEPGVQAVLADDRHGQYFVAERDGVVVGCLLITYEWSDWRNGNIWWVQSVYVAPEHRRQGVFRALCEYAEAEAKANPHAVGLRLYVEKDNQTAQTVYEKLGWRRPGYLVMERMFDR